LTYHNNVICLTQSDLISFYTVFKIVILKALHTILDLCYTLHEQYADFLEESIILKNKYE